MAARAIIKVENSIFSNNSAPSILADTSSEVFSSGNSYSDSVHSNLLEIVNSSIFHSTKDTFSGICNVAVCIGSSSTFQADNITLNNVENAGIICDGGTVDIANSQLIKSREGQLVFKNASDSKVINCQVANLHMENSQKIHLENIVFQHPCTLR